MSTLALPPAASTPTSSKLALPTLPRRPSAISNPASTIPPANTTSNTLAKGDAAAGPSRERASNSPVKDEEDEEDGMMSDEEDEGAAKKKGGASRKKKAGEGGKEYKYSSEISQMVSRTSGCEQGASGSAAVRRGAAVQCRGGAASEHAAGADRFTVMVMIWRRTARGGETARDESTLHLHPVVRHDERAIGTRKREVHGAGRAGRRWRMDGLSP